MKATLQDGFGSFTVDTTIDTKDEYVEPNKQILVVIRGVTFVSLPVGPCEAKWIEADMRRNYPNLDPMIVVAN
jgi:hypothetical protein